MNGIQKRKRRSLAIAMALILFASGELPAYAALLAQEDETGYVETETTEEDTKREVFIYPQPNIYEEELPIEAEEENAAEENIEEESAAEVPSA